MLKLPPFVWRFLNSCIIVLISYCISYLFTKNTFKNKILSLLLIGLYPIYKMSGAGWYATTLNYLWPFGLGIFSLIPIKNATINKNDNNIMKVLYLFSLLFACNQEQMCAIVFGFYLVFTFYLYKKSKLNFIIVLQFIMSILSMIFILTCPGNDIRLISETATWYPEVVNFNIIQKMIIGLLSTISNIVVNLDISLLLLVMLIPCFLKSEKKLIKIISCFPFLMLFIFRFYYLSELVIYNQKITSFNLDMILIIILSLMFILLIIISLYFVFRKNNLKYIVPLIFMAGFMSRIIMCLSPTVYASGDRTYIFFEFSFIIILNILLSKFIKRNNYILFLIFILFVCQTVKVINLI